MPRGVYDRSHLKAKRAATKATKEAGKATAAAALAISAAPKKVQGGSAGSVGQTTPASDVQELYAHLSSVTQARAVINSQQAGHNETLLRHIDGELAETISSLKSWRESRFPTAQPAVKTVAAVEAPPTSPRVPAPAPVVAPAPAPAPVVSAPPLPFTPQAVQEVVKQVQQ